MALDCKTVGFFLKISKEIDKAFQTFCLTARAYLNTQKYGLFCSLLWLLYWVPLCRKTRQLHKSKLEGH